MNAGPPQELHPLAPGTVHGLHAQSIGLVALVIGTVIDRFVRSPAAVLRPETGRPVWPIAHVLRGLGRCHTAATTQVVCRLMSAALFG